MTDSIEKGRQRAIREYRRAIKNHKPPPKPPPFAPIAHATLRATRIIELLRANGAVIFERIAFGAGATRWYYCPDETCLETVEANLRPGSIVSFYFDDRIRMALDTPDTKLKVEGILAEISNYSCAFIGALEEDGMHIDMKDLSHPNDFEAWEIEFTSSRIVFYGKEPEPDNENDGIHAITLTLPDADGIVRGHPY